MPSASRCPRATWCSCASSSSKRWVPERGPRPGRGLRAWFLVRFDWFSRGVKGNRVTECFAREDVVTAEGVGLHGFHTQTRGKGFGPGPCKEIASACLLVRVQDVGLRRRADAAAIRRVGRHSEGRVLRSSPSHWWTLPHSGGPWTSSSSGISSSGTAKRMERATPGSRVIIPSSCSLTTIEWTEGGVTRKYLTMSSSAGARR